MAPAAPSLSGPLAALASALGLLALLAAPSRAGRLRGADRAVPSVDPDEGILPTPHRSNRHLFSFSNPDCGDADYDDAPLYVSPDGNNWSSSNGWGSSRDKPYRTIQHAVDRRGPCQTVYVMEGTHRNAYYGRSQNHNNKVVNLNGVSDLKLLADPEASSAPVLEFDGPGGIVGGTASNPISDIEIAGLDIAGPGASITHAEALADRRIKRTRFAGRGIAIWAGHHVYVHDVTVRHCPGSGIRVNRGDYVTIADSEVHSNTWWSSSAESAIVLAEGRHVDDADGIKMRLVGNVVHDNVNKVCAPLATIFPRCVPMRGRLIPLPPPLLVIRSLADPVLQPELRVGLLAHRERGLLGVPGVRIGAGGGVSLGVPVREEDAG